MRLRINRFTPSRRDLIYSRDIEASLVQPHFVVSGESRNEEIKDMPGIYRQSVDLLVDTIGRDIAMGLKSHMLFYVMDEELKDPTATMASKADSPRATGSRLTPGSVSAPSPPAAASNVGRRSTLLTSPL